MSDLSTSTISSFADKKIAVIGDLVADQYLNGSIARVSREAPVFILRHDETSTLPGCGANAAANVASLGGEPILVGAVGKDANGTLLLNAISAVGASLDSIVISDEITTTTKVRVLAGQPHAVRQQVIRIDYENSVGITPSIRHRLNEKIAAACEAADAVIVSDYNYGIADAESFNLIKTLTTLRKIPVIVDSRFRLHEFNGATSATPNQEEAAALFGGNPASRDISAKCRELGFDALIITNGSHGMTVFTPDAEPVQIPAVGSLQAVDVTGAGDTVIAAYALGLACGLSFVDAARLANHAGGLVVMKKGTAVISADELTASIRSI